MIWLVVIGFPLLVCGLLCHAATRGLAAGPGLWLAPVPALLLVLAGGGVQPGVFPSLFLETTLHFGPYGRIFLLLTAVLWCASGLFAWSAKHDRAEGQGPVRFAFFFLVTLSGNLGVCLAQDLASFYVFFALMSLPAYGLIIHDLTPRALHAGRVYLIMAVIGEIMLASAFFYAGIIGDSLLFIAVAQSLAHGEAGGQGALILVLGLIGFGIKAGVVGLHLWLPLAHPAAPTAASAVLSGVMIKIGLLGWLQLFPLFTGLTAWGLGITWLGLIGAVYGAVCGVARHDPKSILAYSSISQMGLMTMAVGFALAAGRSQGEIPTDIKPLLSGLLLFVLAHGLAKGILFLGVGVAKATSPRTLPGRLVLAGLAAAGLVLAGAPFTGGALVKASLKAGAEHLPVPWSAFFIAMLPVTAVGTTLLLAVFLWRIHATMTSEPARAPFAAARSGAGMLLGWGGLLLLLLAGIPLAVMIVPELQGATHGAPVEAGKGVLNGLWPIALGLLVAWIFCRLQRASEEAKGLDELMLDAVERRSARVQSWWRGSNYCDQGCGSIDLVALSDRILQSRWMRSVPDRVEQRLLYWHTVGVLFVAFVLVFLAVTWWSL